MPKMLLDLERSPSKKSFRTETLSARPGELFLIQKGETIDPDGLSIREETY